MENSVVGKATSEVPSKRRDLSRFIRLCSTLLFSVVTVLPAINWAQTQPKAKSIGSEPVPEPAASAILAAFDAYEVVGMPEAHGLKDADDFILSLIRNPMFAEKVNDIAVECGNSLYQPVLDRYIAGEDVQLTEVRKVWRNTTQEMCGTSGFFEQFFPLVRAINQKLPPEKRLRVLAADPPIDWDQVKDYRDRFKFDRDASIASVMKKEVLSKHRKALMLFGTFHLFHGQEINAASIYEKEYPNVSFVVGELGFFDTDSPSLSSSPFATWPIPSIARAKGTWLGALDFSHFLPAQMTLDQDCTVRYLFPKEPQKPMEDFVDAFLYLGPQDLRLKEQLPADIALDIDYRMELRRREALPGHPNATADALKKIDRDIVNSAESPFLVVPNPDIKRIVQSCLDRKNHTGAPQ